LEKVSSAPAGWGQRRQVFQELFFEPVRLRMLLLAILLGLGGSSVFPVLSLHLSSGLGIEPFWIGVFFACNTLAAVTISHLIARASDKGLQRSRILTISMMASVAGSLLLAQVHDYLLLLLTGMLWFGVSASAQPQLFALSRERVCDDQAALFQSVMRAQISLSWMVGPPLAYLVFERFGFQWLMAITAGLFALGLLLLPGLPKGTASVAEEIRVRDRRIPWLVLSIAAIFAANNIYIIYMPLHVTQGLNMATMVPGLLMGLVAGLEIPVMISGGLLASRWPLLRPLWLASCAGLLFYIGFWFATDFASLVLLQLFNALYIGLAGGLGLVIFQALMPYRLGVASTLFSNAIKSGALVGASLGGVIAQLWGYQNVFLASGSLCLVSVWAVVMANRRAPV